MAVGGVKLTFSTSEVRFVDETVIIKRLYEVEEPEHNGPTEQSHGVNDAPITPVGVVEYYGPEQYTSPLTDDTPPIQTLCHDDRSSELELLVGNALKPSDKYYGRELQAGGLVQEQRYSFNEREAKLMRNYVENMALWV